jgi:methyl-galactoside transport system substrate-binding protein
MKRLPFALAVAALIFASCSPAGKERPKLGLAMHSFDDAVSVAIRRSIETAALDKADLAIINGQNQQSAQNMQVDSFFGRKLGSLAIDPVDTSALGPIIGKAKALRIPIVFFDRMPSDEAMRSWDKLFFVGTRGADAGAAMGEILSVYWKAEASADRNKDGIAQYVAMAGKAGGIDSALLAESCAKALTAAGIRTERLAADWTAADGKTARENAAALIAKFGDKIEAIVCGDNASALGAIDAYKAIGYFKGKKYIPIVCVGEGDLPSPIAEALSAGSLLGTALSDAESQGKAVFDLSYALAKGSDPSRAGWRITDAKYVWIPYKKYTTTAPAAKRK